MQHVCTVLISNACPSRANAKDQLPNIGSTTGSKSSKSSQIDTPLLQFHSVKFCWHKFASLLELVLTWLDLSVSACLGFKSVEEIIYHHICNHVAPTFTLIIIMVLILMVVRVQHSIRLLCLLCQLELLLNDFSRSQPLCQLPFIFGS